MLYTVKNDFATGKVIVADDMILTKDMPTSAGSKMLEGYMSLFDAEVVTKLKDAGYDIGGKASVGEFAIDLLGETSVNGACEKDSKLKSAAAEIVKSGEALAAICLDVNGSVRRAAAQSGLVSVKPTYGTVSRYGTIPVACSGETVSIMAESAETVKEILGTVTGYDAKDGTSIPEDMRKEATPIKKVAVLTSMKKDIDSEVAGKIDALCKALESQGIEVSEAETKTSDAARVAWNILMSAEMCNNVSRYDGVKFGYRAKSFSNIDELYTNSRTESFGELLKTAILFGSETLSTENYMKVYDKALRTRRVITEEFAEIFKNFDAVVMPACSSMEYDVSPDKYAPFTENFYTAPASVTGLPAVVTGGVQIMGRAFSENALLDIAEILEKEGK